MPKKDGFTIVTDQPGMTHVVTKEYLQIWGSDIMINRKFFKWYTIFFLLAGLACYASVKVLRVDSLVWSVYLDNFWIVTLPAAAVVSVGLFIRWWSNKRQRDNQARRQRALRHAGVIT